MLLLLIFMPSSESSPVLLHILPLFLYFIAKSFNILMAMFLHLYILNFHYIAYTALPYYIHKYTFTHFVETCFVKGYRAFSTVASLTRTYSITLLISTVSTKPLHENMY